MSFQKHSRVFGGALRTWTAACARRPAHRTFSYTPISRSSSSISDQSRTLLEDKDDGFGFIRHNARPPKPRTSGVTEIRGPYYSAMGPRYLSDVLET